VPSKLQQTTLADFGGGWNVADSDLNMSSHYQTISENIIRGVNGSFSVRWGYQLFADCRDGTETTVTVATLAYAVTSGSPFITITKVAHGYATGDHVTFPSSIAIASGTFGAIPISDVYGAHGIIVVDADNFKIAVRTASNANTSGNLTIGTFMRDTHKLTGNIIHEQYFNGAMLLFDDIGEIAKMTDDTGTVTRIWDIGKAILLSGTPTGTRHCDHWSSTTFKSTVIACNGYNKDKPLQITNAFVVSFLIDKSTLSNAFVPRADFVVGMQGYVILIRTEYGDPFIEFSAKSTDGTFTREAAPQDAVEVDLSMVTDTINPVLLGAAPFRDKLFLAFYDRGMIGDISVYDGDTPPNHAPNFSDTISENGTISHRTMVPLGNDIIMADYAGVPSVSISAQSGGFVPVRLSELIAPELQKHLASLSEDTLRQSAFALYNKSDRMYMLFIPKCDEVVQDLPENPFLFNDALKALDQALVIAPNHKLFDQSSVTIAGSAAIGTLLAADINGTREIVSIIDKDSFVIQLGDHPDAVGTTYGGGTSVDLTPINDETICYGFEYNKELKIRRWTRIRGLNFDCGASTQRGRIYFAKAGRVYRYGSSEEPIYADELSNYDHSAWVTATAYVAGDRVYDSTDGLTYVCRVAHTSSGVTFSAYRTLHFDVWEQYLGEPIDWVVETPWSDFKMRGNTKTLKHVNHDTEGTGQFDFSVFTNQSYRDPQSYALAPARTAQFSAGDVGGYGMLDPASWGSGRRTREERVWPFPVRGKLMRLRYSGSTREHVRVIGTTMYYLSGGIR
jgi:hypothetical protein